jgi:transposase InsO family protein
MNQSEQMSLESIRRFLSGSEEIHFECDNRQQRYAWLQQLLIHHQYASLGKSDRGLVRRYAAKMTGLSRAQITRLIALYTATGRVCPAPCKRHRFVRRYTRADIELLASTDEAHEVLSGPATRRILEREYKVYGKTEYERLASISVGHLYNLRQHARYRQRLLPTVKTKPTQAAIGIRKKPEPAGRPGYLRVDTVHQGDPQGSERGVYHINAVDEVTQWEIVACVERISEAYLLPVLESMLHQFPFVIHGFHSDNGSEYINQDAARLLEKLRIEQTRSRPRQSGDNGLVESKNGAIIRKQIGYGHIASAHAAPLNGFYRDFLNPYLNYHRPCAQPEVTIDNKGRKRVKYKLYRTPLETLLGLPLPGQYLRPNLSLETLERMGSAQSDTEAARRMQKAKEKVFALWLQTAGATRLGGADAPPLRSGASAPPNRPPTDV